MSNYADHQRAQAKSLRAHAKVTREAIRRLKAGPRLYWDHIAILKAECALKDLLREAAVFEAAAKATA